MSERLLVQYDHPMAEAVSFKRKGDCGIDLQYIGDKPIVIRVGHCERLPAGISVKVPDGFCGFIRARSSTFVKRGLMVVEGVIDSGYTGPLYTMAYNPGMDGRLSPITVRPGERLSQLIVVPFAHLSVVSVRSMPDTERGNLGFGSTGL